jgi:dGTPase
MIYSRENLETNETKVLQPYAVLSVNSRGRRHVEELDDARLPFQRDRDRIIHCRAFRRLRNKTQVFVAHHGDHYRNRLSHSLEVAQVSGGLARSLGLNEDLAEAISLAHDLGHTPFGHAGETTLNECLKAHGMRFEHNEQSRRLVEELEEVFPGFMGLNLSIEVIEGLMKHESFWDHPNDESGIRPSLEAQVVNFGDEIAYQNHDVDDGLRSGIFSEEDLLGLKLWEFAKEAVEVQYGKIADRKIRIARMVSKMIGIMMNDILEESSKRLVGIKTLEDVYACEAKLIGFSEDMLAANKELKDFLMSRLYMSPSVKEYSLRGQETIRALFDRFVVSMGPAEARDFLAGMTDSFALDLVCE